MNIDFFILVIIYLAIILGIHYKLKSPSKKTKQAILKNIDKVIQDIPDDLPSETEINNVEEPEDIEEETMIIDSNELENIKDDISTDFLKYLKVEENDNNETYRKLSDSMDINLTENVKSLDSFFTKSLILIIFLLFIQFYFLSLTNLKIWCFFVKYLTHKFINCKK